MWKYCQLFTQVKCIFTLPIHSKMPLKPMDEKTPENLPFHFGMCTASNTPIPGWTPLTTRNGSSIALHTFTQIWNKVPTDYNGTPHIKPQNCPLPWDNRKPQLLASFLDPADPPHQTASWSNQLFFSQYTGQTDEPTDGINDETCNNARLWSIDYSNMAKNNNKNTTVTTTTCLLYTSDAADE